MNKKVSIGVTIALAFLAMALTASVTMIIAMRHFSSLVSDPAKRQAMFEYVTEIDKLVRQHNTNIDEEKLRTALAKGYIDGINDPYAAYLTADEYKAELEAKEGKLIGYGVEVARSKDGAIVVTGVQKNSPAAAAGLQKGDIVTALDGTPVSELGLVSVRTRLTEGTKIIITFERGGESKALEISASLFPVIGVEGSMLDETVGYIRIRYFNDTTLEQFKSAYASLEQQGVAHFIFDLRGTDGGSLEAAKEVIAYLMPRGAFAKVQSNASDEVETLSAEDAFEMEKASVTLVNGATAGVAELFAGVLQEFGKTTVVGTATAGRGMVQECYPVTTDGSAVKLSTSQAYLMKQGKIEGVGIIPNQVVTLSPEQALYFDLLTPAEDPQLQTALETAHTGQNPPPVTVPPVTASEPEPPVSLPDASTGGSSEAEDSDTEE